nr:zinc finger, CCHC-type [Tanacetum cinerariifolium]
MGFNVSGEYMKTFIGSGIGTGSMQVLHGFKFEVEPLGDHTFEVEPQENVYEGAGLQEVQTQNLMDYQLACDREQHLACKLFGYREDINEANFVVAVVEKINAHDSFTFNNTVACEVNSKWKVGLKDDMNARKCIEDRDGYYWEYTPGIFIHLFIYIDDMVFSYGCKTEIWATKGLLDKAKGNVLGMEIVRDQSGNTLRVSQSRFYNGKLVQTLLEGHSIPSLEGSLLGDCDVEKNDVGMLDKFDRGLQTDVQVFVDFDYAMGRSITIMEALSTTEAGNITFTKAWKKKIWLKGLLTESRYELRLIAGIATGALVKGGSRFKVPTQVEVAAYRYWLVVILSIFEVAAVEKIYAHESLTFNNIVVCEVISKWKAGLKDDMDARSDVYVLSNCCRKCSDDIDGYYWKYTPAYPERASLFDLDICRLTGLIPEPFPTVPWPT